MEQKTAVEWLFMTLALTPMTEWYNVLEQAKEMEKEQIIVAHNYGEYNSQFQDALDDKNGEEYFNKTYAK